MTGNNSTESKEKIDLDTGDSAWVELVQDGVATSWRSKQNVAENAKLIGGILTSKSKVSVTHELGESGLILPRILFAPRISRLRYVERICVDEGDNYALKWERSRFMEVPPRMWGDLGHVMPQPEIQLTASSMDVAMNLLHLLNQTELAEKLPHAHGRIIENTQKDN